MKKETVFYVSTDDGWSDDFTTYKDAMDHAKKLVDSYNMPEIWKRERVSVLSQKVEITKAK